VQGAESSEVASETLFKPNMVAARFTDHSIVFQGHEETAD
jgi:hypothetical protein